jgi:hypothetical protein
MIDGGGNYLEIAESADLPSRFAAFSDFHLKVTGVAYPLDPRDQVTSVTIGDVDLEIFGLNSAWEIDHHYKERASINEVALSRLLARVRGTGGGAARIVAWHHPINLPGEASISNQGCLDRLAKAGFQILLHGHVHRPILARHDYDVTRRRGLSVVGAGTFGALSRDWVPGFPLGYNCISISRDRLTVRSRKRERPEGAWMADARWNVGPGEDPISHLELDRIVV